MNRKWMWITIAVLTGALVLTAPFVLPGAEESHNTNVRYILWKHHFHVDDYDWKLALRFFNVDGEFRMSLIGKTRSEVERWFPELLPVDPQDGYLPYCGEDVKHPGFVWIGDSRWGIDFEGDRVRDIVLLKG